MIALFTDFGLADPYVGQVHAVLQVAAPGVPVIDLCHFLAPFNIQAAAYLLPAYVAPFPADTVFLCVVDPGVGGARPAVYLRADQYWFVGPDNGLFFPLAQRARHLEVWNIEGHAEPLSATFHGRDLFAPVAAALACGLRPPGSVAVLHDQPGWPQELARIVHIDRYGNAITGVRAAKIVARYLTVRGVRLEHARYYDQREQGQPFWYENSNGLVEIAATRASAAELLTLAINDEVALS